MKSVDFKAIQEFHTSQHKYLAVVEDREGQHLEVRTVGFLGRIWMKLGFSSCSMENVAKYICKMEFSSADSKTLQENKKVFGKLHRKLFNYLENRGFRSSSPIFNASEIILAISCPNNGNIRLNRIWLEENVNKKIDELKRNLELSPILVDHNKVKKDLRELEARKEQKEKVINISNLAQ